jgi:hypothetical protein
LGIFDAQLESPYVKDAVDGLAQNTINNYNVTLRQFLRFVNSKENLQKEITIDDLVNEAKTDIANTEEKIDFFFKWLMGKEIKDYKQRSTSMRESSAHMRSYGYLRGFFANLDIPFERKWTRNIPKVKRHRQAIKKDSVYTFFDVDEKTKNHKLCDNISNARMRVWSLYTVFLCLLFLLLYLTYSTTEKQCVIHMFPDFVLSFLVLFFFSFFEFLLLFARASEKLL